VAEQEEEKLPKGYVHGESAEWQGTIQLTAKSDPGGKDFTRIMGVCPRCGHEISKDIRPLRSGAFFVEPDAESASEPEVSRTYLITCNCVFGHENAPEGTRGCGAQGAVLVRRSEGAALLVEHVKGAAADWDRDEWIGRAEHEQLPRMRELAGQWTAMLGVVTGFVAVGTIFDFTKADLTLSGGAWAAYVVFAALALATAIAAVTYGSQAAGLRYLDDIPADVDGRVQHVDAAVVFCRERLTRSRRLALASVVALAIALAVRVVA
jgi:hypothetical protein